MNLIFPVLAQVAWTLIVGMLMGRARFGSIAQRNVRIGQVALGNDAWPDKVKAVGNNFSNQFETPLLFYVLCGAALHVGAAGPFLVTLAWAFVATRVAHTLIHIGSNHVPTRFRIYVAGLAILAAMLVLVLVEAL